MEQLPLRERNKQRIRERILAAAFQLFKDIGYTQTTMDDIAKHAEISRGTLFNYFSTKDSLLNPFVQEVVQTHIRPAVNSYLEQQQPTLQALRFLFTTIYEHVLIIPDIHQAFRQELLRPREGDGDEGKQTGELFRLVGIVLQYGQQRGDVRADLSIENLTRYIGVLYVSVFYAVKMSLQSQPRDYTDEIDSLMIFIESALKSA